MVFQNIDPPVGVADAIKRMHDGEQLPAWRYYSTNKNDARRNRTGVSPTRGRNEANSSGSDFATAYAIRSARYPAFYQKFRTPEDARRALEAWKQQEGTQGMGAEALDQPRVDGGPDKASRHEEQANAECDGSPGPPTSGVGRLPATAPSTAAEHVVGEATAIRNLPPQYMTFSGPSLYETGRGKCLRITCTLEKSYPNFHIECQYFHMEMSETINYGQTHMRSTGAIITTNESGWLLAVEQKNYNAGLIRDNLRQTEHERLDGHASERLKGHRKQGYQSANTPLEVSDDSDLAAVKEIHIPRGFDLGGIWCKADGFYEINIFVPAKDHKHDG